MFAIGSIGFAFPALLMALAALPALWFILRAVPPSAVTRRFPGIALLLGLTDDEHETDRTPWWLLLLRCGAVAAAIIAFAGPILNPKNDRAGTGPLLILLDGSWPSAPIWKAGMDRIEAVLSDAARQARPVAVVSLSDVRPGPIPFQGADVWLAKMPSFEPKAWLPNTADMEGFAATLDQTQAFDTVWLSDGLERDNRSVIFDIADSKGELVVFESQQQIFGLGVARFEDSQIKLNVLRSNTSGMNMIQVVAHGRDPGGTERELAVANAEFSDGVGTTEIAYSLPAEIRNRVTRFAITGPASAGAVSLADDGLKRREIALISGREEREGLELLSSLHYLQKAVVETADILDGDLSVILPANPDVIVLADVASISPTNADNLLSWVEEGGLLVRFAGQTLAASDVSRDELDPLMPVRLRAGGRVVGGAMSWGEPKALRPFDPTSPFFGLAIPEEVTVSAQVMAQPDPELSGRVIASLADGTPLITRREIEEGQVILFHVTANAEWSTLPLSGLFVQMLERLAISKRPARPDAADLVGTTWVPEKFLSGNGKLEDAGAFPGVSGESIATAAIGPDLPPGLYLGNDQRLALNVVGPETVLAHATWPQGTQIQGLGFQRETPLKGSILGFAILLLLADIVATLWLTGRLRAGRTALASSVFGIVLIPNVDVALAQTADADIFAKSLAAEVVLGYVKTGNDRVDVVSAAGLFGLSDRLRRRTSVEPADPVGVDLETDELAFFPFLYWPITADQPIPSSEAYARLNRYLRGGGMILFDTRDADLLGTGTTKEGTRLRTLAQPLDIPPLEPIPEDHVLTRTFYLLQDFPGRYLSNDVWVEAAPPDAVRAEGMPFRNLNDGVTPVVVGGNDWASAWAIDKNGAPVFPIGRGFSGERQREIAFRFGINLIMHVLTGNYKSDQVHVPALLDRLGQ